LDLKKSIEYFEQAIEINSNYALAYAGLADAYTISAIWRYLPREAYLKAKEIALKALKIDNNLAEVHASLGNIACYSKHNWKNAEKEYKRAIEINPNYVPAHTWYAVFLSYFGQFEEAFVQINKALELDPLSLNTNYFNGKLYYYARQYDEAIIKYKRSLEIDKNFIHSHIDIFACYLHQGMDKEAIEKLQEIMSMDTLTVEYVNMVGEIYEKSGIESILRFLIDRELSSPNLNLWGVASYYAMLGEKEQALEWLDKLYTLNPGPLALIKVDPKLDNLRTDPRFIELLKKVGLEE
jgi:tetratricopeptide (TPR) repeat protein